MLEVAGKRYQISFPTTASATDAADEFCGKNAAEFQLTNENAVSTCYAPVAKYLQAAVDKINGDKQSTVPVDANLFTVSVLNY